MSKYIKIILSVIFSIVNIVLVSGQNTQPPNAPDLDGLPYNIPTPTAYSLGKFGTVPVSPYTGTANITIPIYYTAQRGLPLDINLQYDTSGLLLNTLPSWTGHGWSLNAGGMITREVVGYEDELDKSNYPYPWYLFQNYFSYYDHANDSMSLYTSNVSSNSSALLGIIMDNDYTFNAITNSYYADFAPDIFHFNFMGITGRFFLGGDGQWKVHSDHNIEVVFDYSDANNFIYPIYPSFSTPGGIKTLPKTIKGFVLVDDNGYRYTFGGSTDEIEYSTDLMQTRKERDEAKWTADTWMLKSVSDRFGNVLYTFNYSRGKFIVQIANTVVDESYNGGFIYLPTRSYRLNAPVYLDEISVIDGTRICFNRASAFPNSIASRILYPSRYSTNLFIGEPAYNNSHNCPNAYYYLQSTDCAALQANSTVNKTDDPLSSMDLALLTSIDIGTTSHTLRSYALHYNYNSRIHLDSVYINTGNNRLGAYSLKYYNYNYIPSDYLSKLFDHWGYCNGNNNTHQGSTPQPYNPILDDPALDDIIFDELNPIEQLPNHLDYNPPTYPNYLQPDYTASQYGMLTSIEYPTGGCTVLEYGLNTYSKHLLERRDSIIADIQDGVAGGLRITSISDYEDVSKQKLLSKRDYIYSESMNGRSSGILFARPNTTCQWNNDVGNAHFTITTSMLASIIPLSNSFRSHIGYSDVIEKQQNGDYTVYHYSNLGDYFDQSFNATVMNCTGNVWTPYDRFSEREYLCGKLKSQKYYDSSGHKVKEVIYQYNDDTDFNPSNYVWTHNINIHKFFDGSYCFVGGIYKLYYPKISLIAKEEKTWIANNQLICDTTEYIYADFKMNVGSSNGPEAIVRKCLKEITHRGNDVVTNKYQYALGNVMPMNYLPGTLTEFVPDSILFNHDYYSPQVSVSTFFNGDFVQGHRTVYGTFGSRKMPAFEIQYKGNQQYGDTILRYNKYTDDEQLKEYTDRAHIKTKLHWNNEDRLIASATNMSGVMRTTPRWLYSDSVYSSISGEFFGTLPVNVSIYRYNSVGLPVKIKQGNANTTTYEYNGFGGLRNVKDTNGNIVTSYIYKYKTGDEISAVKPFLF